MSARAKNATAAMADRSWRTRVADCARRLFMLPPLEHALARDPIPGSRSRGRLRLAAQYYQYASPSPREVVRRGVRYMLDISQYVDWHIYFGAANPGLERFVAAIRRGDVVVDVGAYIGEWALNAAQKAGPSGSVYALEPFPDNFRRLLQHIELNRTQNVRAFCLALSDEEGEGKMRVRHGANFATAAMEPPGAAPRETAVAVPITTLDRFVTNVGLSSLHHLKIDVEGCECRVLRGAVGTVTRFRPRLFVEIADSHLRAQGSSAAELIHLLRDLGYTVRRADDNRLVSERSGAGCSPFDAWCEFA